MFIRPLIIWGVEDGYVRTLKSKAFGEFWSSKRDIFLSFFAEFLFLFFLNCLSFIRPF